MGVGAVLPPIQAPTDGLYGFVVNGDRKIVAHGGSRALVGKTPRTPCASRTTEVDGAELAAHRHAGERGGGWLAYPWRSQASDTLKAGLLRREAPATRRSADSGGELSGSELSGGELSDEGILRRKVGRRAVGATRCSRGRAALSRAAAHAAVDPAVAGKPRAALDALVEVVGSRRPGDAVSDDRWGAPRGSTCWSRTAAPLARPERAVAHQRQSRSDLRILFDCCFA